MHILAIADESNSAKHDDFDGIFVVLVRYTTIIIVVILCEDVVVGLFWQILCRNNKIS